MKTPPFSDIVEGNKSAERVPDASSSLDIPGRAHLEVRQRGCFITDYSVFNEKTGENVPILYADPDITAAKLAASHIMSPVGPSEGLGGQHGFARWADYHPFTQLDGGDGEKSIAFQAKRPDLGLGVSKLFELSDRSLVTDTTLSNYESEPAKTSLGEHLYFHLENESAKGLLVNGEPIDKYFGDGTEASIMDGTPFFWSAFNGHVRIHFPAGHDVSIQTATDGVEQAGLGVGMLMWHRPGSPSICFEPTLGFKASDDNERLEVPPYSEVNLTTYMFVDVD